MKSLIDSRIKNAEKLRDPAHIRAAILGLFRIAMQHACVSLGEWIVHTIRANPSKLAYCTGIDLDEFSSPSDGGLVLLLSQLLVAVENIGWRQAGKLYWEKRELSEDLKGLVGASKANVESVISAFVKSRNDGVEGHGLAGWSDGKVDIAVLQHLLLGVGDLLPVSGKDGVLMLPKIENQSLFEMKTLRLLDGDPVCYRKIRKRSTGRVLVEVQIQKTLLTKIDASYEVENALLELPSHRPYEYDIFETPWSDSWSPFVHIPNRLASPDDFTGRFDELESLRVWFDDLDSRKCMVYGDGGVGKTTLTVEFLHRVLEGKIETEWRPEVITFYTAKKTRWGLDGLEHISAQDVGVADVCLDIARMLTNPALDRSWFDKDAVAIIQKLSSLQTDLKISRDNHLVILDNTETMAQNDADVSALAKQINELSRRVGRVVLTSRRREKIEALPVQTENLSDEEGADLLSKRGKALKCGAIIQAGRASLKRYSRSLLNKPIALEVFVQAASAPGAGLESAFKRVQSMQKKDLGNFLYDDAWGRMSLALRHVLLLMSRLGEVHDQHTLQLCCGRANVTIIAAYEAIEESKGIATISRFEGNSQISLNPEFYNYCSERTEQIDGVTHPKPEDIEWIQRRHREFINRSTSRVKDKNIKAYRVPSARAAWKFYMEGDKDRAIECYEKAIVEDHENGWLFERYAYSLFSIKKYEQALEQAKRADILLPNDDQVAFTRGIIEGRMGLLSNALCSLEKAVRFGKPQHLCELQKAYAYIYAQPKNREAAAECIAVAERTAPKDKFLDKFAGEIKRFKFKWLSEE